MISFDHDNSLIAKHLCCITIACAIKKVCVCMPILSTSLKLPPSGSFGRKAVFRQDTMSALTSSVKLFDFNKKDLLSAEDYVSGWFGFTVLGKHGS